jgi:proteic killer suppression protein
MPGSRHPASPSAGLELFNVKRYDGEVIRSFRSSDTEKLFHDQDVAKFRGISRSARRKLLMLHRAVSLQDLRVPPGNRLEELKGRRTEQHRIRINDQWRICFSWHEGDAFGVEITDYH